MIRTTSQNLSSSKSKFVPLLTDFEKRTLADDSMTSKGLVVDLSAIVRMIGSSFSTKKKTFQDLVSSIVQHIMKLGEKANAGRIDVVEDTYNPLSIKGPT